VYDRLRKPANPRDEITSMFITSMLEHDGYQADRDLALRHAKQIEQSCFNEVIRICKASNTIYARCWESESFVNLYSIRCGAVNAHLRAAGSVDKKYTTQLVRRLYAGELPPGALGTMSERDLCPEAAQAERDEIDMRNRQKLVKKTSTLYKCPSCGKRETEYEESQTRSLDEGSTITCICMNPTCGCVFNGN
jgi:DNA-directed RNA polymerase subunit M/transcription elongation factor TFIIS